MILAGIALLILGFLAAFMGYMFVVRVPRNVRNIDKLEPSHGRALEETPTRFKSGGMQRLGYFFLGVALFFLLCAAYLFSGHRGAGAGLRSGLVLIGLPCILLSMMGAMIISHPFTSNLFNEPGEVEWNKKFLWSVGAIGILLLAISRFFS